MSPDLENIQLIEQYLEGQLSGEELTKFENSLKENDELREEVEYQRLVAASIVVSGRNELKAELNNIHDSLFSGGADMGGGARGGAGPSGSPKLWMYVSVPALIIGSFVYFFSSSDEDKTPMKEATKVEEKQVVSLSEKSGENPKETEEVVIASNESASTEQEPPVIASTEKKKVPAKPAATISKEESDRQAGEIIVDNEEHGEFDIQIDADGTAGHYTFDGNSKLTLFGNYSYDDLGVDYFIDNDHYYLFHADKVYRLEPSSAPKALVEETDPEVIRYLNL